MKKPKVSIVKCNSYKLDLVKSVLQKSLDNLGGLKVFIKEGESVLLKPNLLMAKKAEESVTTHPILIEALILLLKKHKVGRIALGDSPAMESALKVMKISGIYDVCKKHDVEVLEFTDEVVVNDESNFVVKKFSVAKASSSFDKIINLPKMKTHSFTMFTGAVKNLFGFIPGKTKLVFHIKHAHPLEFSGMLLDLNNCIKPTLNIMDGIIGMEGNGPSGGEPRRFGVVLAGQDALSVDNVASTFLGMKNLPLIVAARRRNLLASRLENIEIIGEKLSKIVLDDVEYPKIGFIASARGALSILRKRTAKYPYVIPSTCISCGRCADICPVDAISLNNSGYVDDRNDETKTKRMPFFDYKKCIRCYCCHEVCPVKAIDLEKPVLGFIRRSSKKKITN